MPEEDNRVTYVCAHCSLENGGSLPNKHYTAYRTRKCDICNLEKIVAPVEDCKLRRFLKRIRVEKPNV